MLIDIIIFLIKLTGWLLLILLGLIVVVLLTVLLIPVRYRLHLNHGEGFYLDSTVSWLLHIVHARITQEGEQRRIILRVFGIILYDSTKPIKPKKLRQSKVKKQRKRTRRSLRKRTSKSKNAKPVKSKQNKTKIEEAYLEEEDTNNSDYLTELDGPSRESQEMKLEGIEASRDIVDEIIQEKVVEKQEDTIEDAIEEKDNLLRRILKKIKAVIRGVRNFFRRLVVKMKRWFHKAIDIQREINLVKAFIKDDVNRAGFRLTYDKLKLLIKHILPTKLRSQLIFGTGDPCSTGQALGVFGVLFGVYGEHVHITPDFENKIFKGSHYAKGRIRIGTLLIIVIKLLLDKKFKQLLRNYRILKEAL